MKKKLYVVGLTGALLFVSGSMVAENMVGGNRMTWGPSEWRRIEQERLEQEENLRNSPIEFVEHEKKLGGMPKKLKPIQAPNPDDTGYKKIIRMPAPKEQVAVSPVKNVHGQRRAYIGIPRFRDPRYSKENQRYKIEPYRYEIITYRLFKKAENIKQLKDRKKQALKVAKSEINQMDHSHKIFPKSSKQRWKKAKKYINKMFKERQKELKK